MFTDLVEKVLEAAKQQRAEREAKIASFNDPLASDISWTSNSSLNTNFRMHKLVHKPNGDLEIKPSFPALLFAGCFLAVGLYVILLASPIQISISFFISHPLDALGSLFSQISFLISHRELLINKLGNLLGMLFGSVFLIIALVSLRLLFKTNRFFQTGRTYQKGKEIVSFHDIHALQVVSSSGTGSSSGRRVRRTNYELNIVLKNKLRITVIKHNFQGGIQNAAREIANFLGKPLWDITY